MHKQSACAKSSKLQSLCIDVATLFFSAMLEPKWIHAVPTPAPSNSLTTQYAVLTYSMRTAGYIPHKCNASEHVVVLVSSWLEIISAF